MAQPSTLYRFRIQVSDIERGVYESLDLRVACHPSETSDYLLTRVIAYALNYSEGLEFTKGLADSDEPAIKRTTPGGEISTWIEIGNPSTRRLNKAAKAATQVIVFTYKDAEVLVRECVGQRIYRSESIQITALDSKVLGPLASTLSRVNDWSMVFNDGILDITVAEKETFSMHPQKFQLAP